MPRVPDEYLDCVVYLYPSIPAAESGQKVGGTGFIITMASAEEPSSHLHYVVTNKHVVDGGNTTVRFNNPLGVHDSREYDERNWIRSFDSDLATYLLPTLSSSDVFYRPVSRSQFITKDRIKLLDMGIGDEVFYAGRFINAEGKQRNRPSLRFGTIAQINTDIIERD